MEGEAPEICQTTVEPLAYVTSRAPSEDKSFSTGVVQR